VNAVETELVLPLLPTPAGVVFPEMVVTIALETDEARAVVETAADGGLLLVPKLDGRFAEVGAIARIEDRGELPNGTPAITVRATGRARLGAGIVGTGEGLWVEAVPLADTSDRPDAVPELAGRYRSLAKALLEEMGGRRFAATLPELDKPGELADTVAYWPDLSQAQRIELLEATDVAARLELAISWAEAALAELEVGRKVRDEVAEKLDKDQREMLLRRQLSAIQNELGESDGDAIAEYRSHLAELETGDVDDGVTSAIAKEIDRLERLGDQSQESGWIRTWLDEAFALPWGERSDDELDLNIARGILDADHTGLEDVKERVVEHLAVHKLRAERNVGADDGGREGNRGAAILTLVGPPGVGKTSMGESVARALGRKFVRMALGGIRDEAEIRGHRRTYVGARPGRLVRALADAGTMNPVILLDEIDKVGSDWRGDPSAALLEVLDPAQNHSFRDHYLEFELDLSDVVFIATANRLDTIPEALLDRVEVIHLDGYTDDEKAVIAKDHILPRLEARIGLHEGEVEVPDRVVARVAADWTREAGVRGLERKLDKLLRRAATTLASDPGAAPIVIGEDQLDDALGKPVDREEIPEGARLPGLATGLAVTGMGGDVLFVEATVMDGEPGLTLTGQLGDVMKESGEIARSYLRAHAGEIGIDDANRRIHVHFPAGAVPKDGPSAGITMATAVASLLSKRPVRADVGMTGEITLQGRVLPIGGVKQKLLAAHRAGLAEVIVPARNERDLEDVPERVLAELDIHLVSNIGEVLDIALTPA
jgi:ATP-dependent Lon protease